MSDVQAQLKAILNASAPPVTVFGTGKRAAGPATVLDGGELQHESLFGSLTSEERRVLALHMEYAVIESRSAGAPEPMRLELIKLMSDAQHAATASFTPSGLMHGRVAGRRATHAA